MVKAVAVNGSPQMETGNTAMILNSFIQGMMDAGADVDLFYASRLKIKPCDCGEMYCWFEKPGECYLHDDMQLLYSQFKKATILILATPVYIPLPGDMQNVINRLSPSFDNVIETRDGRTRSKFRKDVTIQKIVLVSTSGWWEIENFDTVVRIVKELAEDAGVEFSGAVLRPHANLMKEKGKLTKDGEDVLNNARTAGYELAKDGKMSTKTLKEVSRPLISHEEFQLRYNRVL